MKVTPTRCPNCNRYLGDIVSGTPFCPKCGVHVIVKNGEVKKTVHKVLYNGTNLKDVV